MVRAWFVAEFVAVIFFSATALRTVTPMVTEFL